MFTLQGTRAPETLNLAPQTAEASAPARPLTPEPTLRLMPGLLTEISGPGARRKAAELLARYPFCPAAWVETSLEPFPDEVRRVPMHFGRTLFVSGGEDSQWALTTFVNSGVFPFVVYAASYGDEKHLRRLRTQAKKSGTMVILIREEPLPAWQIHYQYEVEEGRLQLLRGGNHS